MTFWNCVNLGGPAYISPSTVLLTVLPLFHTGGLNCYTNPVLHAGGTVLIMRAFDPGLALQLISDPARGINAVFRRALDLPVHGAASRVRDGRLQPPRDRRRRRGADAGAASEGVGGARRRAATGLWNDRDQPRGTDARSRGRRAQGRLLRKAGAAHRSAHRAAGRRARPASANSANSGSEGRTSRRATGTGPTPTGHRSPTAGCTLAMPRASTTMASTTSSIAGRTCTSPAAKTSIRPRWKTCCTSSRAIAEAAVIGIPDPQWGEVGIAIVAVKTGPRLTEAEIHAHCAANLARFKCPRLIQFVDALPRNATGKIHKPTLRSMFGSPGSAGRSHAAAS